MSGGPSGHDGAAGSAEALSLGLASGLGLGLVEVLGLGLGLLVAVLAGVFVDESFVFVPPLSQATIVRAIARTNSIANSLFIFIFPFI